MKLPDRTRLFDALFDEEEFASALDDIAAAIGARSYVGGFAFNDGTRALNIANDYYGADKLAEYYRDFFEQDPWNKVVLARWKPDIMMDPDEVLTRHQVEWSGLYQDFIRPMGDDTYHAIAVTAETPHGIGSIGFQRGRGKSGFSDKAKEVLQSVTPDLARVLALRGKVQGLERDVAARSTALDALGDGMIMLDANGRIVMANAVADAVLRSGDVLRVEKGRLDCRSPRHRKALAFALEALPALRHAAVRLESDEGTSLDLTLLALPPVGGVARTLVAFPTSPPSGRADILRQLYGLSAGEAEIAILLTDGLDPAEIAAERGTSLNTVRVQLRTIGEKLGVSRLIDIVRRVASLPRVGDFPPA